MSPDYLRREHWQRCCEKLGLTRDHPQLKQLERLFVSAAIISCKSGEGMQDMSDQVPADLQTTYGVMLAGHQLGQVISEQAARAAIAQRFMAGTQSGA